MGEQKIEAQSGVTQSQDFVHALLADVSALERMLDDSAFDRTPRIGAEQEMFLVDRAMRPAPLAMEILESTRDPRLTTEMGRFNIEANLAPQLFTGPALRNLEQEVKETVGIVRNAARNLGADVVLAGILPTIHIADLTLANLAPKPRYAELNRTVLALRNGVLQIHIKGLDELSLAHDNVMLEACCTSFQVHLQVNPADFARIYNWAQAITGPLIAVAANSPLLLGQRLWKETRIALFQHSVDERSPVRYRRDHPPRVNFGDDWIHHSVLEILREDIARFRIIFTREIGETSLDKLARGETPELPALKLHNGTIWRWNRPCYGIVNGQPHLRIELRALPAGPSIQDEIANAAFALGLLNGFATEGILAPDRLRFDDVKENFQAAARHGLKSQMSWFDGREISAHDLILNELLPVAHAGLHAAGIDSADTDRLLGIIAERVKSQQTGATWMLHSFEQMEDSATREQRLTSIVASTLHNQQSDLPVHEWPLAQPQLATMRTAIVGDIMSTDLFTARPDDLIDLAAKLMDWRKVRHVPVEDNEGRLLGIISHRDLLHYMSERSLQPGAPLRTVSTIMTPDPIATTPLTPAGEALRLLVQKGVGCLPVVDSRGLLVGIVTSSDFLPLAEDAMGASA